jgi:hypothetical protein
MIRTLILITIGLVAAAVQAAEAQGVAQSFDELRLLVRRGDAVTVVDVAGVETTGKIAELSSSRLVLRVRGQALDVFEADARKILHRHGDSLSNGAWIGLCTGAVLGSALIVGAVGEGHGGLALIAAAFYGGVGAGIGVGIDALVRGRQVIYASPGSGSRALSISPLVTPGRRGAVVSFRF